MIKYSINYNFIISNQYFVACFHNSNANISRKLSIIKSHTQNDFNDCHTESYRNLLMIMKSIAVALNYN